MTSGDLAGAVTQFGQVAAEAKAAHDEVWSVLSLGGQGMALAYQGEAAAARAAAGEALQGGRGAGGHGAPNHPTMGGRCSPQLFFPVWIAEARVADGALAAARRRADEAV